MWRGQGIRCIMGDVEAHCNFQGVIITPLVGLI